MNGYRDNKRADIAYISEYVCADKNYETECDFVAKDFQITGGSDYVIGDTEYYNKEIFYGDAFKCPKCGFEVKFPEVRV